MSNNDSIYQNLNQPRRLIFFLTILPLSLPIKSCVWIIEFKIKACEDLKIKEFIFVNDCFQIKHNEDIGLCELTLVSAVQ